MTEVKKCLKCKKPVTWSFDLPLWICVYCKEEKHAP